MQRFILALAAISFLAPSGIASQKEITVLNLQTLQNMISTNKGKVILIDFWASF